ncbi:n-hydroxybenzoate transporter [Salmonella enterica subsp. enterica]|uniref:N-hydroxybenzoate transporter n=1 Tax=Salmonella enterica I TaxID=59201 RepID=A0A3S4IZ60_SALET|nr:n-hydroxybenzoate transporter [Salmonella enterica subsp. enterica]
MTQRRDLQALIDAAPVGKMQWRVIICCFLVVMLDGFDTAAIGFIAPDIRTHWQLSASELAPLFGAGLLGLTAGALLCGPLADRFGRKRVIELCVALFGALSLLSAFSPDIETLVLLRFLTGLGLGGAMPNTITIDVGIPSRSSTRSAGHADVLRFYPGVGDGWDCERATGAADWLARNSGARRHLAFDAVFRPAVRAAGISRWQVRRQLPQAVVARTVSAITGERYHDTQFFLHETAAVAKGSIRQLFAGRQLVITLMLWVVFFMSLLIIYLLSSWMPTLLNHRGIDLQQASWVTAAFQVGGTLGALLLGVLMDRLNPFRVLAVSYALGAVCIVMIGLSENGLWLMALAIFGTGIGISGSQVGLNALTATLYPTQSRATGVSWSNAIGRCGAIVGSLSGGMMMALNFSFDTLFFVIAIPAAISAVMLTLLTVVVRLSISVPDDLPRASVVNE